MKLHHRRALFLGAFFLFTVVAPVVILGASGYRYSFQEQVLIPTGTLVLKSYPEGAKIFINRQEEVKRTPAEIQGLSPSRYTLELEADGFRPWRKEVEVQGHRITAEDQILLIPKRIAVSSVLNEEIRTFAVSPDGRNLVYVRPGNSAGKSAGKSAGNSDGGESLWLFSLEGEKERLLFPLHTEEKEALSSDSAINRLLWLMEGQGVAFSISTAASRRYFILPLSEGGKEGAFEVIPPEKGEIDQWKWSKTGLNLFFMQGRALYRADYETKSIERVVPDPIQGYSLLDHFVYFVTVSPPVLFKQDLGTGERTEIAALPIESEGGLTEQLVLSAHGEIALIDRRKVLWLIDPVPSGKVLPVAGGVQAALFDETGGRLLYQTKQGLIVHHLQEGGTLGAPEAGSYELVVHRRGAVIGPTWYSDQFHILYGADDAVYITETGGQGPPNTYSLLRIPGEAPKFVYHDRDQVYFLFRNRLYQADLAFGKPRSLLGSRS